jgi:hypothetical protein
VDDHEPFMLVDARDKEIDGVRLYRDDGTLSNHYRAQNARFIVAAVNVGHNAELRALAAAVLAFTSKVQSTSQLDLFRAMEALAESAAKWPKP